MSVEPRLRRVIPVDGSGDNIDSDNPLPIHNYSSLVPESYDEYSLAYVTSGNGIGEIETVIYKKDSVTVATITLSYDVNDNLIGVVRS